ncbi:MAG: hypothetical protein WDN31_04500 [Hyphomicrobium sp.]
MAALLISTALAPCAAAAPGYAWQFAPGEETLEQRVPPPQGFARIPTAPRQLGCVAARPADEAGWRAGAHLHGGAQVAAGRSRCRGRHRRR